MSAAPLATPAGFESLDACHQQILQHLILLTALAQHIDAVGVDDQAQRQAAAVEAFFSGTSRQHHLEEEKSVFPPLLASGNTELVALVRVVQQDHGWIEENWLELAPQLRAMASGNAWVDGAEFQHNADVFQTLCRSHIELEEKMIYPQAKAFRERSVANRLSRVPL
ncbi:MAG: hemerythrin domain-containing protein [Rhodoferax sp.]|nr:hemerythrin domain-containing protein [Rhodoferax sp.]